MTDSLTMNTTRNNPSSSYDTIVIGAGPTGATAATVLAMKGRRVLVLEKDKFPRYHVGESLIPHCYFTLERIGMIDQMRASRFPKKYSVQFVTPSGKMSQPFYFTQHRDHPAMQTWQVVRSEFDQMLLDNARAKGATILEEMTVKEFIRDNGTVTGVRGVDKTGQSFAFRTPVTIDASGRDGFSQIPNGWRVRDPMLNKIAIWTYFQGAIRDPGMDEGATTVAYLPDKGWFWYIPWPDNMVSVGIVAEADYLYRDTRDLAEIFCREIGNNAWIKQHLAPGKVVAPYRVTAEFSYRAKHCAENGLVLAGDAFAFLDPVFSSGVFLALKSGEMAADAVDAALSNGDVSATAFDAYGRDLCAGIEAMRKLVYAFYDRNFSFKDVIMKHPHLRGRLTDCLIGDLFTDFDELFHAVAEFAQVPPPLPHGKPFMNHICASST
jgi:flavin-dependent dehydrogenase